MLEKEFLAPGVVKVTFSIPLDEPQGDVSVRGLTGDWSDSSYLLIPNGNRRSISVNLPVDRYEFKYLATGGLWFNDADDPDTYPIENSNNVLDLRSELEYSVASPDADTGAVADDQDDDEQGDDEDE